MTNFIRKNWKTIFKYFKLIYIVMTSILVIIDTIDPYIYDKLPSEWINILLEILVICGCLYTIVLAILKFSDKLSLKERIFLTKLFYKKPIDMEISYSAYTPLKGSENPRNQLEKFMRKK